LVRDNFIDSCFRVCHDCCEIIKDPKMTFYHKMSKRQPPRRKIAEFSAQTV
jgi:hypothetical protein